MFDEIEIPVGFTDYAATAKDMKIFSESLDLTNAQDIILFIKTVYLKVLAKIGEVIKFLVQKLTSLAVKAEYNYSIKKCKTILNTTRYYKIKNIVEPVSINHINIHALDTFFKKDLIFGAVKDKTGHNVSIHELIEQLKNISGEMYDFKSRLDALDPHDFINHTPYDGSIAGGLSQEHSLTLLTGLRNNPFQYVGSLFNTLSNLNMGSYNSVEEIKVNMREAYIKMSDDIFGTGVKRLVTSTYEAKEIKRGYEETFGNVIKSHKGDDADKLLRVLSKWQKQHDTNVRKLSRYTKLNNDIINNDTVHKLNIIFNDVVSMLRNMSIVTVQYYTYSSTILTKSVFMYEENLRHLLK